MTGQFDGVVGIDEIVEPIARRVTRRVLEALETLLEPWARKVAEYVREDILFGVCRACDSRPAPPHDNEAEDRVLSALLFAETGDAFVSLEPAWFYGLQSQRVAFVLLQAVRFGEPVSHEDLYRRLCASWPQHARAWAGMVTRIVEETAANALIGEDIERLRLLYDIRENRREQLELMAESSAGRMTRDQYKQALMRQLARFESKGQE